MKQNEIQHIDDLIIDEQNIENVARKYQSQGGFIQNFCIINSVLCHCVIDPC